MPSLNKIFLETDGLIVGDNQLSATGGGVYVDKSLSVGDGFSANNVTAITGVNTNTVNTNTLITITGSMANLSANYAVVNTRGVVGNTVVNTTSIALGGSLIANNDPGQSTYVLTSGGANANAYWTPLPAVVGINSGRAVAMALVFGT